MPSSPHPAEGNFSESVPGRDHFFSPDSMIWRVDREMILLLGGGRALLMQLAHPKVAAGVSDHSRFREDPLGRLHRTMDIMWSILFEELPKAEASLQAVNEVHRKVRGTIKEGEALPKGTTYDALDPDLLLWVHATLVESALLAYDLFVKPLSAHEKSQYYTETKKLAVLFGIPEAVVPASLEDFSNYMSEMMTGAKIAVGPTAHVLAREILHPRPLVLKIGGPLSSFVTVGLLPERLREAYRLRWNERREQAFRLLAKTIRQLLPLIPAVLRIVPHARAAEKRLK